MDSSSESPASTDRGRSSRGVSLSWLLRSHWSRLHASPSGTCVPELKQEVMEVMGSRSDVYSASDLQLFLAKRDGEWMAVGEAGGMGGDHWSETLDRSDALDLGRSQYWQKNFAGLSDLARFKYDRVCVQSTSDATTRAGTCESSWPTKARLSSCYTVRWREPPPATRSSFAHTIPSPQIHTWTYRG